MDSTVFSAYADAIFQIGKTRSLLALFLEELGVVKEVCSDAFIALMDNPNISKEEKCEVVDTTFASFHHMIKNFLKVLVEKNRFKYVREIVKCFEKQYYDFNNIQEIFVTSATTLSTEKQAQLISVFAKKYNKQIKMNLTIDSSLIAGLIVRVNDEVYDNTVINQLSRMKARI